MANTLESTRSLGKLLEYDREHTKNLRKTILDDVGNPRLKKDMLDLIQRLETGQVVKKQIKAGQEEIELVKTVEGGTQPVRRNLVDDDL